jgi:hypothetical protein
MDNAQRGLVNAQGNIDLHDPHVRARVEYLGAHAERSIVQDFVAKHPELLNVDVQTDVQNKQAIDNIMNENGLTLSPENLELAYRTALEAGQLQFAMYHPLEEAAFPRMTTKQMEEYLRKQYQAPPKPNMAELLPQFGERAWNHENPTLDDEQCQALREKLLRQIK